MPKQHISNVTIEDARLIFRNFAGKKGRYNSEGIRSFCVVLDEDTAVRMKADGWNVRWLPAREEGDIEVPYINVTVSYLYRPPKVTLISSSTRKKSLLYEDDLDMLDWAEIETADLIINPHQWTNAKGSGIKAYLGKIFITIKEDKLDIKYADVADSIVDSPEEPEIDD